VRLRRVHAVVDESRCKTPAHATQRPSNLHGLIEHPTGTKPQLGQCSVKLFLQQRDLALERIDLVVNHTTAAAAILLRRVLLLGVLLLLLMGIETVLLLLVVLMLLLVLLLRGVVLVLVLVLVLRRDKRVAGLPIQLPLLLLLLPALTAAAHSAQHASALV